MPTLPLVVIVTGVPASGKTTLAGQLAAELRLPLFCKDQIKETLFDTLGTGERPWSRKLGAASNEILYRIVESQLSAGRSCIVESNFQSEYASARFQTLRDHTPFQIAQVLCTADGQVLLERFRARTRHPGHLDHVLSDELVPELTQGRAEAIAIEGTVIEVDTTNPEAIPLAEIVARLRGLLGGELPRSARIVRDYLAMYADPISIQTGDRLKVGRTDDEWPEYVWCTAQDGRSGWVPQRCFRRISEGEGVATRDYSARELTVHAGEVVALIEEIGGWWWCAALNGRSGWVPADRIANDE